MSDLMPGGSPPNAPDTVTVFGDGSEIDQVLSAELARRGSRTHTMSAPGGWLPSTRHAVIRADTHAGDEAIAELSGNDYASSVIVVIIENDSVDAERLRELCVRCGERHAVWLIWYPPVDTDDRIHTRDLHLMRVVDLADVVADHLESPTTSFHELRLVA